MIKNYFKAAWRNITRNKVYTGINILGLSLGLCACLVIYLIASFEFSFDTFHPDKDRIYRIVVSLRDRQGNKEDAATMMSALPMTMRNELTGFENVTDFFNISLKVTIPDGSKDPRRFAAPADISDIVITGPQYFDLFKSRWLAGNEKTALNEPFKVVLTESKARKYFGDADLKSLIGRDIIYHDSLHLVVSGIIKDPAANSDFKFNDYISFATIQHSKLRYSFDLEHWNIWDYDSQGYVKLAKGVTPAQIEKQFPAFVRAHIKVQPGSSVKLGLQPLSDVHFNEVYNDSYTRKAHLPALYGLMGIACFILIIAVINFVNLSTAQSLRRAKEVGVRKVLGGSRSNLTVQFLMETFMVTVAAVVVAVVITNPVLTAFHTMVPRGVVLNALKPAVLIFLVLITLITALLAGLYPARVLSSYLPVISLKGRGIPNLNSKSYLRKTLIIFQFTISLVFIIGAVVVNDQIHFILNKDLGFNKDAIITTHTAWSGTSAKADVFEKRIKQVPGVQLVSRHKVTPAAFGHPSADMAYSGANGQTKVNSYFDVSDSDYVPLFGLKIIAGRNLLYPDSLKEILVNETCARALGFKTPADAVGKMVDVGVYYNRKCTIVGVLRDFHATSLHDIIEPFFIGSLKNDERAISIKLSATGKSAANFKHTIAQIEKISKDIYPAEQFEYRFFDETIAGFYQKEQKTASLISAATAIAIFISCMGLFGLATFTAQQRVKEIGIRKVLGAGASAIVSMLSRDFLGLVVIAFLIASPIAYYFTHSWLRDFAYRINISWWIFLLSGAAAIIIAFATISFQCLKAAFANPINSLRSE